MLELMRARAGETCGRRYLAGLTVQRLTRAARAHVATAARRTACLHVSRAMQAARRRSDFDFPSRLGRRAEAGPRRVLPRVRRPLLPGNSPNCECEFKQAAFGQDANGATRHFLSYSDGWIDGKLRRHCVPRPRQNVKVGTDQKQL